MLQFDRPQLQKGRQAAVIEAIDRRRVQSEFARQEYAHTYTHTHTHAHTHTYHALTQFHSNGAQAIICIGIVWIQCKANSDEHARKRDSRSVTAYIGFSVFPLKRGNCVLENA